MSGLFPTSLGRSLSSDYGGKPAGLCPSQVALQDSMLRLTGVRPLATEFRVKYTWKPNFVLEIAKRFAKCLN
jgi:hypothetical protein